MQINYNHSRKAGNKGDVWKHAVLLVIADRLSVGDHCRYVKSHSGAPVHRLNDAGEWQHGVGRVMSLPTCLSDYRTTLSPWVDRREYPASWVLVANRLAGRVDAVSVELADISDEVATAHRDPTPNVLADNVRVNFTQADGFDLAVGAAQFDLVFMDPPFRDREREWQLLARTCMHLRNTGTAFLAWYPYSWPTLPNWIVQTTECETWEVLWAQCGTKASQDLKGCGMLVSKDVSTVLHNSRSSLEALPACLGWELRVRQPTA